MIRIKPECVELVMEKTAVGDWFLLYLLGQNIDHIVFKVTNYNQSSASSAWMITLWTVNQEKLYGATFFRMYSTSWPKSLAIAARIWPTHERLANNCWWLLYFAWFFVPVAALPEQWTLASVTTFATTSGLQVVNLHFHGPFLTPQYLWAWAERGGIIFL